MNITVNIPVGFLGENENDTKLDSFLRMFAKKNEEDSRDWSEKYGVHFKNEKFIMRPFCWCEKEDCPMCRENDPEPNFWYKPLDFKVWWYKYIGRGVETNKKLTDLEFQQMTLDSGF